MITSGTKIVLDKGKPEEATLIVREIGLNSNKYSGYAIICGTLIQYDSETGYILREDNGYRYKINFDESSTRSLNLLLDGVA